MGKQEASLDVMSQHQQRPLSYETTSQLVAKTNHRRSTSTYFLSLERSFELLRARLADDEPRAPARSMHSCAPRADVRLHLHLVEHRVGLRGPVLAVRRRAEALRDAEEVRADREELFRSRKR